MKIREDAMSDRIEELEEEITNYIAENQRLQDNYLCLGTEYDDIKRELGISNDDRQLLKGQLNNLKTYWEAMSHVAGWYKP